MQVRRGSGFYFAFGGLVTISGVFVRFRGLSGFHTRVPGFVWVSEFYRDLPGVWVMHA